MKRSLRFIFVIVFMICLLPVNISANDNITLREDYTYFSLPDVNDLIIYPNTSARAWPGYSARNIKYGTVYGGNNPVRSYTLDGGTSADYNISTTVETTVNGVLSIGGEDVNVSLGLSNSSSITISDTLHADCPKSSAHCVYEIYQKFQNYTFDEYFLETKSGSGSGSFLIGYITFLKEFNY